MSMAPDAKDLVRQMSENENLEHLSVTACEDGFIELAAQVDVDAVAMKEATDLLYDNGYSLEWVLTPDNKFQFVKE